MSQPVNKEKSTTSNKDYDGIDKEDDMGTLSISENAEFTDFIELSTAAKDAQLRLLTEDSPAASTSQATTIENENREMESDGNENEFIFWLNDDCLLHIFSYLNILELMNLETVCSRFYDLISSIYCKRCRVLDFAEFIRYIDVHDHNKLLLEKTLMMQQLIITRFGKYIKELTIPGHHLYYADRLIKLFPQYCTNLEVLTCNQLIVFNADILSNYMTHLKHLKVLTLNACDISDEMLENGFETADSLLELSLPNNVELTGRCLTKTKNLNLLNIIDCSNIQSEYLSEVCRNNKTLTYLNIAFCSKLNRINCQDIAENLINLEHLVLSSFYPMCNANDICKLVDLCKLKKLEIRNQYNGQCYDEFINKLAIKDQLESIAIDINILTEKEKNSLSKFSRLKEIIIRENYNISDEDLCKIASKGILKCLKVQWCDEITNAGALKCVELSPDLEILGLFRCSQVDEEFILGLPNILSRRNPPIKLIIEMSDDLYDEIFYLQREYLLDNKLYSINVLPSIN